MHPLRFPNNGIRAKVFVQKIGFKLHVMILNLVESFHKAAKAARRRGGQPPCRADHPRPGRLHGAASCGQGPLQGGGRPWPKPLAGVVASMRGPLTGMVGACGRRQRSQPSRKGQRPSKEAPPAHEVPPEGSSARCRGGCPRQRRATLPLAHDSGGSTVMVKRARASF
ncbi:hypothetical protein B296_00010194 [Ensete ventricosum]|uniref:Uncharacterized protein n=1 Tax=Ensete ventricosum TaxID=4639 RepID=A0A427B4F9_ENSVE|nr:hypothetical protein B296_00010194 [Ensete ventricosum]